jgi:hypothetical protein
MVRPGWDEQGDPTAAPHPNPPPQGVPPTHSAQAEARPPAGPDGHPYAADARPDTETPPDLPTQPGASPNGYAPNGSAPGAGAAGGSQVSGVSLPAYTGPYPASGEYPDIPPDWRRVGLPPSPWPVTRPEAVAGIATVVALAVLGVLSAFVWLRVAPRLGFQITADGAAPVRPEEEQFFATDAWFVLLTVVWGLVAAVALWRVPRLRGPAAVVTLAVGGVVGAIVTWRLGLVLGPAPTKAATETVGNVVYPALKLRALSALVIEPLGAVGLYLVLVGFGTHDLGRGDTPPYAAGGGWIPPAAG